MQGKRQGSRTAVISSARDLCEDHEPAAKCAITSRAPSAGGSRSELERRHPAASQSRFFDQETTLACQNQDGSPEAVPVLRKTSLIANVAELVFSEEQVSRIPGVAQRVYAQGGMRTEVD